MSVSAPSAALPLILDRVTVAAVRRLAPSYVRVELAGPALADLGVDGPTYDQRIKLVVPHGEGSVPSFEDADAGWYAAWLARPLEERGHLRTYTVRDVVGSGRDTRLVVDLVVHGHGEAAGAAGPGSTWAARARVGDPVGLVAPRRGVPFGGIEFAPGGADRVLLVGDETAVPAVCAILEQLPPGARGAAYLEVPVAADIQDVRRPAGVELTWLPREGAAVGALLRPAVAAHLGARDAGGVPVEVDPDLWETPTYSSSGEEVAAAEGRPCGPLPDLYAWIAGESRMVTGLRRLLVRDLGMDRRQVAFMGYWREGVAMGS